MDLIKERVKRVIVPEFSHIPGILPICEKILAMPDLTGITQMPETVEITRLLQGVKHKKADALAPENLKISYCLLNILGEFSP